MPHISSQKGAPHFGACGLRRRSNERHLRLARRPLGSPVTAPRQVQICLHPTVHAEPAQPPPHCVTTAAATRAFFDTVPTTRGFRSNSLKGTKQTREKTVRNYGKRLGRSGQGSI